MRLLLAILLLYSPILYYTAQYLIQELSLKVSTQIDKANYKVHQIFIPFGPMPEDWKECSASWQPFQVTRWDREMCETVILKAMPNRRELIDYHGVMFTDVCRVAIMYVHGGVYADMDVCADYEITFPDCDVCFFKTSVGVSNDLIISRKNHPVFLNVLHQYADYAWVNSWFYLPYIREMYSTGPVRFSLAVSNYPNTTVLRYENLKITHIHGNSWHSWDAVLFMHPWVFIFLGIAYAVYRRKRSNSINISKDV